MNCRVLTYDACCDFAAAKNDNACLFAGANVEEVEDIIAGTDEDADAEQEAAAEAVPAPAKPSTMSEERRKNLVESQQLLDDLGAASAAMRATWSGFM